MKEAYGLEYIKRMALKSQMKRLKTRGYKPHKCEPKTAREAYALASDRRR